MTTVLIIVCILFCIGVVLAITGHLGYGIARDRHFRFHIRRHHDANRQQSDLTSRGL